MALIKCPICNHQISDKATRCVKCNYDMEGSASLVNDSSAVAESSDIEVDCILGEANVCGNRKANKTKILYRILISSIVLLISVNVVTRYYASLVNSYIIQEIKYKIKYRVSVKKYNVNNDVLVVKCFMQRGNNELKLVDTYKVYLEKPILNELIYECNGGSFDNDNYPEVKLADLNHNGTSEILIEAPAGMHLLESVIVYKDTKHRSYNAIYTVDDSKTADGRNLIAKWKNIQMNN